MKNLLLLSLTLLSTVGAHSASGEENGGVLQPARFGDGGNRYYREESLGRARSHYGRSLDCPFRSGRGPYPPRTHYGRALCGPGFRSRSF